MRLSQTFIFGVIFITLPWLAYDHYRPWVNFHSEALAFVGLSGLMASVLLFRQNSLKLPWFGLWIGAAILIPWLQYATGISFFAGDALVTSLYLSGLLAAVFVGYSLAHPNFGFPAYGVLGLMHSLWIAALVSAGIGLAQWLDVQEPLGMYLVQTDLGDRAMGNLGQPNQLATLLIMGMVALVYVFERQLIGRFGFFLAIGFMTGVLVMTQSRAGMLSVLVVTVFLTWKKSVIKSRLPARAVAGWAVAFVFGTIALPYLSDLLLLADVRAINAAEPISQRLRMWQQIAFAIGESPWWGYGWNQTPTASAAGAIAFPGPGPYTYAHNFVMDLLAWNGLPLGLLLTGAIAYWFVTRIWSSAGLSAVHAMACLLPFAVHSMVEYPFAYAYFLIAAGLMAGVVEAARGTAKSLTLDLRWAWSFWLVWVAVGSCLAYEYFLIEEDFRIVRFENLRIGKTPEAYEIPNVQLMSHMAAMLKASRQRPEPNMAKAEIETLRQVSERFEFGPIHFRYAIALALNGNPEGASHRLAIIRGVFGDFYFKACVAEMRRLEEEKYPQLALVAIP
ncbi:PglL family O-oligosaccharyltransferase [Rhodoferax sp. PAMC 29310]|uniref:PglL family O-oligosaccharyltransferase n=1 Tax=Rhodoferax sp. PAMC 29310 TaxID=2822760 RepID=UPI001B32539B|nr:O-antigen ligase family protein [Rhodoferax sp. PAMC 29310]